MSFLILNQLCISGMNSTWSRCILFKIKGRFIKCWILSANLLVKLSALMFMSEMGLSAFLLEHTQQGYSSVFETIKAHETTWARSLVVVLGIISHEFDKLSFLLGILHFIQVFKFICIEFCIVVSQVFQKCLFWCSLPICHFWLCVFVFSFPIRLADDLFCCWRFLPTEPDLLLLILQLFFFSNSLNCFIFIKSFLLSSFSLLCYPKSYGTNLWS